MMIRGFDLVINACIAGHNLISAFNGTNTRFIWWVHDGRVGFECVQKYLPERLGRNIKVYCGGSYAQKVMKEYCPSYETDILLYGVEDRATDQDLHEAPTDIINFLFPATFEQRKNQMGLVKAVGMLPEKLRKKARFVMLGLPHDRTYYNSVVEAAKPYENITISGPIPYQELMELYSTSQCIVVTSTDDPMPVVLAEAMMLSKIVISSDMTGTAGFIDNGVNGFVFPHDRIELLSERLQYVIENHASMDSIRREARKTYEKYYSKESFKKALVEAVENSMR